MPASTGLVNGEWGKGRIICAVSNPTATYFVTEPIIFEVDRLGSCGICKISLKIRMEFGLSEIMAN
jgi:hypothetical protein